MATVRQRFEELLRYQKEVGMLSKSDPLFAQKLAQVGTAILQAPPPHVPHAQHVPYC